MTKQQEIIHRITTQSKSHLTAEQIYFLAKEEYPNISIATVYRTLGIFVNKGILRKLSIIGLTDYYEANLSRHQHMVCEDCGEIIDITIPGVKEFLENHVDTEIQFFDLLIHYKCRNCEEKNERKKDRPSCRP